MAKGEQSEKRGQAMEARWIDMSHQVVGAKNLINGEFYSATINGLYRGRKASLWAEMGEAVNQAAILDGMEVRLCNDNVVCIFSADVEWQQRGGERGARG